jgi:hypothetical protein
MELEHGAQSMELGAWSCMELGAWSHGFVDSCHCGHDNRDASADDDDE